MGLRGPPPRPTALRELEGNPSGRPLNKFEPQPRKITMVEPPASLKEKARIYWYRVLPILSNMGVLTEAELPLLERYCDFLADWHHNKEFLERAGNVYYPIYDKKPNADGTQRIKYMQPYPHVSNKIRIHEVLLKIESHFGMTPASRSRIITDEAYIGGAVGTELEPSDPFDVELN